MPVKTKPLLVLLHLLLQLLRPVSYTTFAVQDCLFQNTRVQLQQRIRVSYQSMSKKARATTLSMPEKARYLLDFWICRNTIIPMGLKVEPSSCRDWPRGLPSCGSVLSIV